MALVWQPQEQAYMQLCQLLSDYQKPGANNLEFVQPFFCILLPTVMHEHCWVLLTVAQNACWGLKHVLTGFWQRGWRDLKG